MGTFIRRVLPRMGFRRSEEHHTLHENSDTESFPSTSTSTLNIPSNEEFVHPAVSLGASKIRLSLHAPVLLAFFAIFVVGTPFTNQLLYQTCLYEFDYTSAQCEPLLGKIGKTNETNEIENKVQPYVTYMLTVNTMITNVLPALFCLVIGPWSDKYGRRPVMLLTLGGYFLSFLILSVLSGISANDSNLNPWLFLVSNVPVALTGGACVLTTMIFAYLSDVYSGKNRAVSMIVAQTLIGIGEGVGGITSGLIYNKTNLLTIFIIATVAMGISFVWMIFVNIESLAIITEASLFSRFCGLFSMDILRKFWKTSTQMRQPYYRMFIWCIIFSVIILNFANNGEQNINYLFLSKKFDWTLSTYNLYVTITAVVSVVGCILCVFVLIKLLKLSTITLILIVMITNILDSLIRALAAYSWQVYIAKVVGCLMGIGIPILRSILSMLVTEAEVGTIFSTNNSLQYLVAIGASPLYSIIYTNTLSYDPAVFNFLSVGLYLICIGLVSAIFLLRKHIKVQIFT